MKKSTKKIIKSIKKGPYTVALTHTDKIMLPDTITKGDIITYYDKISDAMVPYMKNRALMMHRYPEGLKGEFFYQKEAGSYFPSWIKRARIPKEGGFVNYVVCQNGATLVYLANQDVITPHLWLSRIDKLYFPDRLIFDLDPSDEDFTDVRFIALALKKLFDALNLTTFVMTTGSRGLHVHVPLDRKRNFKEVKKFAKDCAMHILQAFPSKATLEIRKEKRGTKIFIDTLRNEYGATAVAPYGIRAKAGAPVATPLAWDEVEDKNLSPQKYTINNIFKRLDKIEDPWKDYLKTRQSLTRAIKILANKE